MRFGLTIPNFGAFGDAAVLAELARSAEASGWDGVFVWDQIRTQDDAAPTVDPWIALAAIALATERITLGPMVTPLPRRRPWQVARQSTTLDHLSRGRLVLGVGIGGDWFGEYAGFGEPTGDKLHAAMLDEALQILLGLWSGEPVRFSGEHYQIDDVRFLPTPVQRPRIPIWVGGYWPNKAPFRRAARFDGAFPTGAGERYAVTPEEAAAVRAFVAAERSGDDTFEVIVSLDAWRSDPALIRAYADAGVTWLLQALEGTDDLDDVRDRVAAGPPTRS